MIFFLKYHIRNIEAAAYMQINRSLVRYRLKGLKREPDGCIHIPHRILAKVSRPEVAEAFMRPAPLSIVNTLVEEKKITPEEAELSQYIPMSHDICVESDSGGHTDKGIALALFPTILRLRDEVMLTERYSKRIRVGAAGGIGTPEAAAAVLMLGAEFIMTGSINQCTVEAGTSDAVKDLLQTMKVQDTTMAPAGDMFEIGARVQVLRRGLLFPARANRLYELYRQYQGLHEIDSQTAQQIQEKYFKRSFHDVWEETKTYYLKEKPDEITKAEQNPKHKMVLIFRWYFIHTTRLAMKGSTEQPSDYQIHTGPALGAFNQWVKGTPLENWRARHVDVIAKTLLQGTADFIARRWQQWSMSLEHAPVSPVAME